MGKHRCGGNLKKAIITVPENPKLGFRSYGNDKLDSYGKDIVSKIIVDTKKEAASNMAKSKTDELRTTDATKSQPASNAPNPNLPNNKVTYGRWNKERKDIIITSAGIIRNLARYTTTYISGDGKNVVKENVHSVGYNFLMDVQSMSAEVKAAFFKNAQVEILVKLKTAKEEEKELADRAKLGDYYEPEKTALNYLKELGTEFAANITEITVAILHPKVNVTTAAVPFDTRIADIKGRASFNYQSPNFLLLDSISSHLNNCPNINYLALLHRFSGPAVSMPQILYSIAFYPLAFQDWVIKYAPYDSLYPATIRAAWILSGIDVEYRRMNRQVRAEAKRKSDEERKRAEEPVVRMGSAVVHNICG